MSAPTWLPPLNSHGRYLTAISIEEAKCILDVPLNSHEHYVTPISIEAAHDIPGFPRVTEDMFFIDVLVLVKFFAQNDELGFPGLLLKHIFAVPCRAVGYSPSHCQLFGEITNKLLPFMRVPFQLHPIYFRETNNELSPTDGYGLIYKILGALYSMRCRTYSKIVPLRLKMLKSVLISNDEYDAWTSWYAEKIRADPDFKDEYTAAIGRPRTNEELLRKQMVKFKAATAPSIKALEVVKFENSNCTSNCLVCLEDISPGSKATRLPCFHVFHRDCIVKWLQESHMCPLYGFMLPT